MKSRLSSEAIGRVCKWEKWRENACFPTPMPTDGHKCARCAEDHMAYIEPTATVYGLGEDIGKIEVFRGKRVTLNILCRECGEDRFIDLDPADAPLFRLVANRLDEISGKREVR